MDIQKTQNALDQVRTELKTLEAEYSKAGVELDNALVRFRTGDKKAESAAGRASMQRATLSTKRERLLQEELALSKALIKAEADRDAELAAEAVPAFEVIDSEARELERQLVEVVRSAADIARKLKATNKPWQQALAAVRDANACSQIAPVRMPRIPSQFLKPRVIDDTEKAINNWLGPTWTEWARNRPTTAVPNFKTVPRVPGGAESVLHRIRVYEDGDGQFRFADTEMRESLGLNPNPFKRAS